jgi:hypothetical protein
MTDILLISNEVVKSRMAIGDDILGVAPFIESAIGAAQLRIGVELDSNLQFQESEDIFHLDPGVFNDVVPAGLFRLKLRSGLARKDLALTITSGRAWNECNEPLDITTAGKVDYIRGIVYVDQRMYSDKFVKVAYSSGYEDSDIEIVPDWLTEAILAYVPVVWNFGAPTNRNDEAEKGARMSGDHAMAIVSPYLRNIGFTYRPVF